MAMGECSVYSSLQADPKVKFAAWPTSWRPPGADRLWPNGLLSFVAITLPRVSYESMPVQCSQAVN